MIDIEECVKKESESLHGCLRNGAEYMLQMVLKEKVLVDDILQDYQRRRKVEAVSNWNENSLHGEFALQLQM